MLLFQIPSIQNFLANFSLSDACFIPLLPKRTIDPLIFTYLDEERPPEINNKLVTVSYIVRQSVPLRNDF